MTILVTELLTGLEGLTSEATTGAAIAELVTTSTLGTIVADLETPFMEKHGPACPVEELKLVVLPLSEQLSRFNAKGAKGRNTMLVTEETKGIHTLTIFLNRSVFLLTH